MAEYCLRWNNHQPNLVTVFSELLTSEALVDVTLASDGQAIRAHRLVLSACSAYFKDLFRLNPCAHPIVFLKDIHYEDLKTVIDFIYKGEVNVAQDRLQDVLKTAELLRIKGLADKPFNYDEYSSQTREPRLSSSFSSQRSSLTDSRDHVVSTEADDGAEAPSSPRPAKRRKIASQDSSESQQDSGHDSEERTKAADPKDDRVNLVTIDEDKLKDEPLDSKEPIKEEKEATDRSSDQQESGAVDAMLLLHGSSSENEGVAPPGLSSTSSGGSNGRDNVGLLGSHSQGRGKRAILKRQPEVGTEDVVEDIKEENFCEYILPENVTLTPNFSSMDIFSNPSSPYDATQNPNSRLLQVPTLVVGSHDSATVPPSPNRYYSKSFLTVPSTSQGTGHVIRQHSQPSSSSSGGGPQQQPTIAKQRSQPSVLAYTTHERFPVAADRGGAYPPQQQVTFVPMNVMSKQRSSPGSLQSFQQHLRPILPKSCDFAADNAPAAKKDALHFYRAEDEALYNAKFTRAVSEEPNSSMNTLGLPAGTVMSLAQSVSQDTGLDAVVNVPTASGLTRSLIAGHGAAAVGAATPPRTTVSHTPVLRNGPALGCNFCWNTAYKDGRVQRRKTKYHCVDCNTNLCIVPCFHEYHNQRQVKQEQQKQITKILTKTSSM